MPPAVRLPGKGPGKRGADAGDCSDNCIYWQGGHHYHHNRGDCHYSESDQQRILGSSREIILGVSLTLLRVPAAAVLLALVDLSHGALVRLPIVVGLSCRLGVNCGLLLRAQVRRVLVSRPEAPPASGQAPDGSEVSSGLSST